MLSLKNRDSDEISGQIIHSLPVPPSETCGFIATANDSEKHIKDLLRELKLDDRINVCFKIIINISFIINFIYFTIALKYVTFQKTKNPEGF